MSRWYVSCGAHPCRCCWEGGTTTCSLLRQGLGSVCKAGGTSRYFFSSLLSIQSHKANVKFVKVGGTVASSAPLLPGHCTYWANFHLSVCGAYRTGGPTVGAPRSLTVACLAGLWSSAGRWSSPGLSVLVPGTVCPGPRDRLFWSQLTGTSNPYPGD